MLAAEGLALEIEPLALVAPAEVLRGVTGFRPESASDEPSLVGQAVLADLSTFIERVSERLPVRADERPGGASPLREASERLGVSERTLLRHRSLGLAVHWIDFGAGVRRVGCFHEVLERFRSTRLGRGAAVRRRSRTLSREEHDEIVGAASALARDPSITLPRAAAIIAKPRSLDPRRVQRLLAAAGLRFAPARRRSRDDLRLAYRAWRRGIDPRRISDRLERDKAAMWRAINAGRRTALRSLRLPSVDPLPTFGRPEATEVLLAPDCVRRGLRARSLPRDPRALVQEFPAMALPPRAGEQDACRRLVTMRFLLWRAARGIASLPSAPTNEALDRIETDLRNAATLRRTLVAHVLPASLGRVEASIGSPIERLSDETLAEAVRRAVLVSIASLDLADATEAADGRLRPARHAALLMDRDLALHAVRRDGVPEMPDLEASIAPWLASIPSLPIPEEGAASGTALPERGARASAERALLGRRYGWDGALALTVAELAKEERLAPSLMQRRLLDAMQS